MKRRHITSEDDFLALIATSFPNTHPSLILGRGDDCAEIRCPATMAVSTDVFVEDIHFRRAYFSPLETGYKALAVNISDMAAAGARPLGISVGLVTPVPLLREEAEGILVGMRRATQTHAIALTGGDLSRGDKLSFCVTIWGEAAQNGEAGCFLRRGPVAPGDALFLCGTVGLARAGLLALEATGTEAKTAWPAACNAHLMPVPLVDAGLALCTVPGCRLMDVSDGLARDLPRMLRAYGADCGAEITLREEDLHPEVVAWAHAAGEDAARFAFLGGEDYALLGACLPDLLPRVAEALRPVGGEARFLPLGTVTARQGITLNGTVLPDTGFDHFA